MKYLQKSDKVILLSNAPIGSKVVKYNNGLLSRFIYKVHAKLSTSTELHELGDGRIKYMFNDERVVLLN